MSDTYGAIAPDVASGPQSDAPPALDPSAGAGWKQGLQRVAGAIGNAAGRMQFSPQGSLTTTPPAQAQNPAAQQPNQQQQLIARAQALLKTGAISPAQFAQITGQPMTPGMQFQTGVAAPGTAAPSPAPMAYQPPAPPTGPTSQAWNQ